MIKEPLFSVLIANYNNGQYLQEAIESVMAQDYTNWEIIIVDDKSTDNSIEIYNTYADDKRIHVFYNLENKGVTYTKWNCLEHANGEICGFLDADDAILPHALSLMVSEHIKDEEISIISSRYYICDENMNIQKESDYLRIPEGESYLTYMHYAPWHFVSFKASKYKQTKGLNPKNKIGDDQELYLLLEEVGKWHVIDDITYKYRQRASSISHDKIYECRYWNIIIYHEACTRRGIPPHDYSYRTFKILLDTYAYNKIIEVLRKNKAYKLGKFLLSPLSIINKLIKNFIH